MPQSSAMENATLLSTTKQAGPSSGFAILLETWQPLFLRPSKWLWWPTSLNIIDYNYIPESFASCWCNWRCSCFGNLAILCLCLQLTSMPGLQVGQYYLILLLCHRSFWPLLPKPCLWLHWLQAQWTCCLHCIVTQQYQQCSAISTGLHLFNVFLNDQEIEHNSDPILFKYADDSTLVAPIWYNNDTSAKLVIQLLTWSKDGSISCNPSKH